jgi:hypothetical protein
MKSSSVLAASRYRDELEFVLVVCVASGVEPNATYESADARTRMVDGLVAGAAAAEVPEVAMV